jgi:excisionase family DNA binding protein
MPDQLLTTTGVALLLDVHKSTITRWVAAGKIAYVQKLPGRNGEFLFDPVEVERVRLDYQAGQVS